MFRFTIAPWEDAIRLHRDQAKAAVRRCLENAVQLDQAKRAKYRAAAEAVLDAMGPAALKRWNENVRSIAFYPDTESVDRWAQRRWPAEKPYQAYAFAKTGLINTRIAICT